MVKSSSKAKTRGVLYCIKGPMKDEALKLRRDQTIFGRDKGDIVIRDSEISSTHCQIQNINNTFHIFDMNSTNGTYLNNQRIIKAQLQDGDTVLIGQTVFKFKIESENEVRHLSTAYQTIQQTGTNPGRSGTLINSLIESSELKKPVGVKLHVEYVNGTIEELEIMQTSFFIGRASSFGQFDRDQEISRKHLLVKVNDQFEIFVEDQNSTNGSFVNGEKIIGMVRVQSHDTIKVGTSLIKLDVIVSNS